MAEIGGWGEVKLLLAGSNVTPVWTRAYGLVGLGAALVTGVRRHRHHRLDLSGAGHDAPNGDQLTDAVGSDVAHNFGLGGARRFKVELAVDGRSSFQSRIQAERTKNK